MNYIFVSTDLDLPTNQASEDSKRQVTQSSAERQETNACLALPRTLLLSRVKPKGLEKKHLKLNVEGANHTLKLSFADGIIFQIKVNA